MGMDDMYSLDGLMGEEADGVSLTLDDVDTEEFDDIAQTNEDIPVDGSMDLSLAGIIDVREQEGFEYPAILISGVRFNDVIRILQTLYRESLSLMDVWLDLDDGKPPVKQGKIPADLQTFLVARYLGLSITLYPFEGVVHTLDLQDPYVLEQFI